MHISEPPAKLPSLWEATTGKTQLILAANEKIPHVCLCIHVHIQVWNGDENSGGMKEAVKRRGVKHVTRPESSVRD